MSEEIESSKRANISRRGFLKGIGLGTVATGLAPGVGAQEETVTEGDQVLGPGETLITLNVNGTYRQVSIEPRVTLLDALRNRINLTGSKKVCDRGTCGACTVMVDGQPVYACSMLAMEAEGRKITTIEGLGTAGQMNPVQEAFVKHDAQQCGFCTPGFVVACTAFLQKHPEPTLEQIKEGLGGNLCRCGTYAGMMNAALEASQNIKGGASWQR